MSTLTSFRKLMSQTQGAALGSGSDGVTTSTSQSQKWEQWIDLLLRWRHEPDQVADEGLMPPARQTIDRAIQIASSLKATEAAPTTVVPDGDGGISFEWHAMSSSMRAEILSSGEAMFYFFTGGRLIHSEKLMT